MRMLISGTLALVLFASGYGIAGAVPDGGFFNNGNSLGTAPERQVQTGDKPPQSGFGEPEKPAPSAPPEN